MPRKPTTARKDAPPSLPSRDHFERAHFAVQASVYLQQLAADSSSSAAEASSSSSSSFSAPADRKGKGKAKRKSAPEGNTYACLARSLGRYTDWSLHNQVKV
jgi:hypothetical protein